MSRLEHYHQYREQGRALHAEIIDAFLDRNTIDETARTLGCLDEEGTVVYETDDEQNVHVDFFLYEYREDGQTPLERYLEEEGADAALEGELLDAMIDAETSLFRVTETDPDAATLALEDVLGDRADLELTDESFSQTVRPDTLLFLRPLELEGLTMTSGLSFSFDSAVEDHLLTVFERVLENTTRPESVSRFVTFHRLNRKYGLAARYV